MLPVSADNSGPIAMANHGNHIQSPMNKELMHGHVNSAIARNTEPKCYDRINCELHTEHDGEPTRNGKNQKEEIIALKKAITGPVVIFVKKPKRAVHEILVSRVGNPLHTDQAD